MTYKEAIVDSLNKIEFDDHTQVLPFIFPNFLQNMAIILCEASRTICSSNKNTARRGDEILTEPKDNPDLDDVLMVLSGEDLLNGLTMQSAVQGFVQWFLDQEVEEPDDNDGTWLWYDIKPMVNMWNKFVSKNNPAPMPSDTQDPFSDIFESVTGKASGSRTKKSRKSKKKTTN